MNQIQHTENTEKQTKKLLRLPEVINRTGLPRSTIYLKIAQGTFPQPITLGERSVAWIENEIATWIEMRISKSRQPTKVGANTQTETTRSNNGIK